MIKITIRRKNKQDNDQNRGNAVETFSAQQQILLARGPTAAPPALPDYTNGHEKGYQNVRVSQGKPLTSGNTARFLLSVYSATVACRPEQYQCPQIEQP